MRHSQNLAHIRQSYSMFKIKVGEAKFKPPGKRVLTKVIKNCKWFIKHNWAGASQGLVLAADPPCQESNYICRIRMQITL